MRPESGGTECWVSGEPVEDANRPVSEFLEFENVSKHYGSIKAVDHVSLTVKQGEFFFSERMWQNNIAANLGGFRTAGYGAGAFGW